eukprot:g1626.t1
MAAAEYNLTHSRLLDLLEPPPPPKRDEDDEEDPEDEQEEEEEEGAVRGPPPPAQLLAQREVRERRLGLEARQAKLVQDLEQQIKLERERVEAAHAAEERAAARAARKAAREKRIAEGGDPEEEEEEDDDEEEEGAGGEGADDAEDEENDEDDEDAPEPEPERSSDEIRDELESTYAAWREAQAEESTASMVCVGLQAGNSPRPGPVECTFDTLYDEERAEVWATARVGVADAAAGELASGRGRAVDLLLVLDTSPTMEPHMRLLKRSLNDLVRNLEATDRLCIIGVSYKAQVLLDWTSTDGEGKVECRSAIRDIMPRGGATLCASGMAPILELLSRSFGRARPKALASALWLCGSPFGTPDERYEMRRSFAGTVRATVASDFSSTLSVFGVGEKYDAEALSAVADAGRGAFAHLPDCAGLSEHVGRWLALRRTTAASHLHAIIEGSAPVQLIEAESGYGLTQYDASQGSGEPKLRKSTYFRSGRTSTVDLGQLSALQTRSVAFKVKLPSSASANKLAGQTPLARVVFVYATGEASTPHVHSASLRAVDVPRLCTRKPRDAGAPLRFLFTNEEEQFDARPFQVALAQKLGVPNGFVPVDSVTHHRYFDEGHSIVDMRVAKQGPEATAGTVARVEELFAAGELAQCGFEPETPEVDEDSKAPEPEDGEEEAKDAEPQPAAFVGFERPGLATLRRVAQLATASWCRAMAAPGGGDGSGAAEASLRGITGSAAARAADPAGLVDANCNAEMAVAGAQKPHALFAVAASHAGQHPAAQRSPALDEYVTAVARKFGDSLAVSQCDREQVPLQMSAPSVEVVSASSLQVSWDDAEIYSGPPVAHYVVHVIAASTGDIAQHKFRAPRRRCCIANLDPGAYHVSVRASNGRVSGTSSPAAVCTVPSEPSDELAQALASINVSIDDARWRWYPSLGQWDRVPDTAAGEDVWPARVTEAQCLRDSIPSIPAWTASVSGATLDASWELADGNGATVDLYMLVVLKEGGAQQTFRYGPKVRAARIPDLSPGVWHAALLACSEGRTGVISDPVRCEVAAEQEQPLDETDYFEFRVGSMTYTRSRG